MSTSSWGFSRCSSKQKHCSKMREPDCIQAICENTTECRKLWIYLDLVEILSCLERDDVIGRDASNGLICGVFGSVEGQCRFTWYHLRRKTTRTVTSLSNESSGPGPGPGPQTRSVKLESRSYKDFSLLRSEVPLHAGMSISVKSDFDDALLYRLHRCNLVSIVARHRCSTKT